MDNGLTFEFTCTSGEQVTFWQALLGVVVNGRFCTDVESRRMVSGSWTVMIRFGPKTPVPFFKGEPIYNCIGDYEVEAPTPDWRPAHSVPEDHY